MCWLSVETSFTLLAGTAVAPLNLSSEPLESTVGTLVSQHGGGPTNASFEFLDWLVLAAYAVLMLAVGVYYGRRNKNAEDYLLGGRSMKPWTVGVSLFATLMSTLTYLAVPGEMIQHGPMILSRILATPLIYLVVARFIIPFIMKLRVTSAYEILEQRLGLSVRMLGSTLFLVLRFLWMALIVYATSSVVLVPIMHLDPSATPWVCVGMAVLTVAYTSMGGLQAVVFTDVLQTFIMLGGALLSIILITVNLGGVSAWWPTVGPHNGMSQVSFRDRCARHDEHGNLGEFCVVCMHCRVGSNGCAAIPCHARYSDCAENVRHFTHMRCGRVAVVGGTRLGRIRLLSTLIPRCCPMEELCRRTPTSYCRYSSSRFFPPASVAWLWREFCRPQWTAYRPESIRLAQ